MSKLTPTQRLKWRKRGVSVTLNSAQNLLIPALNITISALVIRLASKDLWGQFVSWLITAQLIVHVLAWGNKDYLLRQFSQYPNRIATTWRRVFLVRGVFLCAISLLLSLTPDGWLLVLWIIPLFIAQSFEVMIVFRRHFAFAVITEMCLTVMMLIAILTGDDITQTKLFAVFILSAWARAGVYGWRYWRNFVSPNMGTSGVYFAYFRLALPFFLLGLSGMLASRIDLYTLSAIAEKSDVASYQVVINLLLYVQAGANFILIPFVKTLYRLDEQAIRKIATRLFLFGCIAIPPIILLLSGLVLVVYDLTYPVLFWVMGGLFALPIFAYLPLIHRLYGLDAQRYVLWVNLGGAAVNGVLNLMLIPPMGITGALLASALCQWGMLGAYMWKSRGEHDYVVSDLP